MTYLTVSIYSTSVFRCIDLADGTRVLYRYNSMQCNTAEHMVYMALGLFGTAFYMVGFPFLVALVLWNMYRRNLRTDPDFIEAFGFVYTPFEASVFYYGELLILRRTLFVAIFHVPYPLWQA